MAATRPIVTTPPTTTDTEAARVLKVHNDATAQGGRVPSPPAVQVVSGGTPGAKVAGATTINGGS
jgi:hypothetical protein